MLKKILNIINEKVRRFRYKQLHRHAVNYKTPFEELKAAGYFSQYGQDKWVFEELMQGKKHGVFVDIGAHDGISLSNTYFLERNGWSGLAIEPNPSVYEKLIKVRKCICLNGCIAPTAEKKTFRVVSGYAEMLSGLVDEYDPKHLDRIKREISLKGGDYKDIEVDCYSLNELIGKHEINFIDYLTIDVEGVELEIIKSIDFSKVEIGIIGVENNYKDPQIPQFLISQGYIFHSKVGCDDFYIKKDIAQKITEKKA